MARWEVEPRDVQTALRMRAVRRAGTSPELAIRRELHRRGLRYRVQYRPSWLGRRSVDIAFPGCQVAVLVHGCFWHGCPEHRVPPRHNAVWWAEKVAKVQARDHDTSQVLRDAGWHVLTVWEHEDVSVASARIKQVVTDRRARDRTTVAQHASDQT